MKRQWNSWETPPLIRTAYQLHTVQTNTSTVQPSFSCYFNVVCKQCWCTHIIYRLYISISKFLSAKIVNFLFDFKWQSKNNWIVLVQFIFIFPQIWEAEQVPNFDIEYVKKCCDQCAGCKEKCTICSSSAYTQLVTIG